VTKLSLRITTCNSERLNIFIPLADLLLTPKGLDRVSKHTVVQCQHVDTGYEAKRHHLTALHFVEVLVGVNFHELFISLPMIFLLLFSSHLQVGVRSHQLRMLLVVFNN